MFTADLYMYSDEQTDLFETWFDILRRMGWNYDTDEEHGKIIINVPFEDEAIFNFIFRGLLVLRFEK